MSSPDAFAAAFAERSPCCPASWPSRWAARGPAVRRVRTATGDFALYHRGSFGPQRVRRAGWAGDVSEIGGWGGG